MTTAHSLYLSSNTFQRLHFYSPLFSNSHIYKRPAKAKNKPPTIPANPAFCATAPEAGTVVVLAEVVGRVAVDWETTEPVVKVVWPMVEVVLLE